jgi:glycosyltransferase involved in cell wall biosynthesis
MRILHISADYPDPLDQRKPKAISNLVALAGAHQHRVISINRMGLGTGIHAIDFADAGGSSHRAVAYEAPPKGILFKKYLGNLARWLLEDCRKAGFVPDLIHAHKLTVEGTVGMQLAESFGVPLALSIQGNTDLKILKAKFNLRGHFRQIWHGATVAFPFAIWAQKEIDGLLGARATNSLILPCPGPADSVMLPEVTDKPIIRTAFNLHDVPRKNCAGLIRAIGEAAKQIPDIALEVIGGGDAYQFSKMSVLADEAAPGRVKFLGFVPNNEVQQLFHDAAAFALVSHRESFGMVFAEALLAGTPCLIPRGQAIDGYFEDGGFVLAADAGDVSNIAAGLVRLVNEQAAFKDRLGKAIANDELAMLTQSHIRQEYLRGLEIAVYGR